MALTTHVLDTALGRPAAGVEVTVLRDGAELARARTDADGRARLLERLEAGTYELRFAVGDYHARSGHTVSDPPFLDIVPIRFGVADPGAHHHVPLLVAPFAYSTYRGS